MGNQGMNTKSCSDLLRQISALRVLGWANETNILTLGANPNGEHWKFLEACLSHELAWISDP